MGARSKARKQSPTSRAQLQALTIQLDHSESPTMYVNILEVAHTFHEFAILIARTPTKVTPETLAEVQAKGGRMVVSAEAQLILPPTVIPLLIEALKAQREKYEKKFGPIKSPPGFPRAEQVS